MRVSLLESEVAVYRQSAGLQLNPVSSELSGSTVTSRKRKSDDLSKYEILQSSYFCRGPAGLYAESTSTSRG